MLQLVGRLLHVRIKRHHAARRYRLRYDPVADELRLTLPPRQRLGPAQRWVRDQEAWIVAQLAARPSLGTAVGPGTILPWQGGELLISWRADAPRAPERHGDRLLLGGPEAAVPARVKRWLQASARHDLGTRSRALADAERLPLARVSVGDPRSRWGSCSARGAIRYNWRLIMAPDAVREAVVAHEVAHLAHMNHGPAFHALANRLGGDAMPLSRAWLRANGAALHALRFDP